MSLIRESTIINPNFEPCLDFLETVLLPEFHLPARLLHICNEACVTMACAAGSVFTLLDPMNLKNLTILAREKVSKVKMMIYSL